MSTEDSQSPIPPGLDGPTETASSVGKKMQGAALDAARDIVADPSAENIGEEMGKALVILATTEAGRLPGVQGAIVRMILPTILAPIVSAIEQIFVHVGAALPEKWEDLKEAIERATGLDVSDRI